MIHSPDLSDEYIAQRLNESYGLSVARIAFLPVGDAQSAIYRVETSTSGTNLLKLSPAPLSPAAWLAPGCLRSLGVTSVMAPLMAKTAMPVEGRGFAWLLYPFLEGVGGFEKRLSPAQWARLGETLAAVHSAALPAHVLSSVRVEDYSTRSLDGVLAFDEALDGLDPTDAEARIFCGLWKERRQTIRCIARRTHLLGNMMRAAPRDVVLCHGDLHAGNILIGAKGEIAILDWDDPVMAPRERDLMFIGAGVGGAWNATEEVALFYEGYRLAHPDPTAMAYYRYERIITDMAVYCTRMLGGQGSRADRLQDLRHVALQFDPNQVVEIAHRTWTEAGLDKMLG